MTSESRGVRIQLMIALMCAALLVYIVLLGRTAILMIGSGRAVAIALGGALLILPAIGVWAMVATLRAGLAHQKLARLAADDGMELDVSALPRRPSGRIERDAADALFADVRAELETDPRDWRRWYRLARAYDYAGDRSRAREAMKKAVETSGAPMSKTLLIVHHTPSPATRELLEAVLAGANDPDIEGVDVVARPALAATVPDVLDADGYLFGTPANLGYMSGALKHFFDTVYYPSLDHVAGRPYGLWVHGNDDTVGAVASVEKVVTGLALTKAADALEITGAIDAGVRERAYELGGTLAATLME